MSSLPITPHSGRAAPPGGSPKSAGPPTRAGDFAALLTQTTARTALAEGPKTRPAQSDQAQRREDRVHPGRQDDAHRADASREAHAARDARAEARAQDAAQPDDAPPAPADGQPTDAAPAAPGADGQTAPPAEGEATAAAPVPPTTDEAAVAAAQAAATAATAATAEAGVAQGTATGTPLDARQRQALDATLAAGASLDGQAVAAGAEGTDGAAAGKLQIPAELLDGKGAAIAAGHGKAAAAKDGAGELPPLPTLPPSANAAATAAQAAGPGGDPGANANANGNTPNNPPAPQPQPAPVAQGQAPATPQAGFPTGAGAPPLARASVAQTAERVQELVRIATTRAGNARATLQLRPEALGQIDVQLRTTRDGLVATIAAHDQAGLDALQQAGAELRRALEDRGVNLHSLDLQLGAGAEGGFANQGDARQASAGRPGTAAAGYDLDDEDAAEAELTLTPAPSTPAGVLVDVQA